MLLDLLMPVMVGATTLATLCQQAETRSHDGGVHPIGPLVEEIADECARVRHALDALHARLGDG